ncbi:cellobiose dehydrogenase [Dendryphion nanum]|uniref:Cellobiose dehydrogenase n=1 Tax=Dendryphion nanum TaxID=256645 RepID=A0A9P9DUV8_9PLEO|nr:cellobiose dehydrogenase [Dendryphion nanum]
MRFKNFFIGAQIATAALASPLNQTWDYIVVGSGAAGIPLADKLSESGKSVLLIERGWPSTGRWGGTRRPAWLEGTNLTRFDVPALYQYVWGAYPENEGIWCQDYSAPASCILGGGTAINAAEYYLPHEDDFDLHQPPGFRSKDIRSATSRLAARIPWTSFPSADGKSYLTNGSQIALDALTSRSLPNPYPLISANSRPNSKSHHLTLAQYFLRNGERSGPLATYLVTASSRPNFRLLMNTMVSRAVRSGSTVTGVNVESTGPGGFNGTINLNPKGGRLILSAGVFGSSKILFRSGIGPRDQLAIVQSSTDAPYLPKSKDWIELPIGQDLDDAPAIQLGVRKDDIGSFDFDAVYNNPIEADKKLYLEKRSGPLAMIQPSLGPTFWDEIKGDDKNVRRILWNVGTGRVDIGGGQLAGVIGFASSLKSGKTSRGRLGITSTLFMNVTKTPYFNDAGDHDFKALNKSASAVLEIMKTIKGAELFLPPSGVPLELYLREAIRTTPFLSSNHWVGSAHMSASCKDPKAVVDATTKVCGTKNLHVVDAGVINGVPAANPQAVFMVVAEKAAEVILGLGRY